jgi:DNA polymerase III alpha subunit
VPADARGIDHAQLAACRSTLHTREGDAVRRAQRHTGGWGAASRGLGLGGAELAPGEMASLFPEPETPAVVLPGLPDVDELTRGRTELELLGLTVTHHPVELHPCAGEEALGALGRGAPERIECRRLDACVDRCVALVGWLAATRRVRTSDGKWMRFLTLEDRTGVAEVVLFPDVYAAWGHKLVSEGPFCISGRVEDQLGACTLHAERIW